MTRGFVFTQVATTPVHEAGALMLLTCMPVGVALLVRLLLVAHINGRRARTARHFSSPPYPTVDGLVARRPRADEPT